MAGANRVLNDLLLFFSPIHRASPYKWRPDYIVETPIGCFRPAYSSSTHSTALFYARHLDDLVGEEKSGRLEIAHKRRLMLVKLYKVHHGSTAKFLPYDGRQQFDLTWLRREIARIVHDIPRILFREANLQRIDKNNFSSAFISYEIVPSKKVGGEYSVIVRTKANQNYLLTNVAGEEKTLDENESGNLLRATVRKVARALTVPQFILRTQEGEKVRDSFTAAEVIERIQADFSVRLGLIWDGFDPVHWDEQHLLPFIRAGAKVRQRTGELISDSYSPEDILRKVVVWGTHLFIDGPLSTLESILIDKGGEFGARERFAHVTPEWHKIIDSRARRLVSIESALHKHFIKPDSEQFGDFEWLSPQRHLWNFVDDVEDLPKSHPFAAFQSWLSSNLPASYDGIFEYRNRAQELVRPWELSAIHNVKLRLSNNIRMHYMRETGDTFAYYHGPDYVAHNRRLPLQAAHFLQAGQVLVMNARHHQRQMKAVAFEAFQAQMRQITGVENLIFPSADQPPAEAINPKSAKDLRIA